LQTILLRNKGKGTGDIADFLRLHQSTRSLYINRSNIEGIDSLLWDKTRKPGKESISQEIKEAICRIVCTEKPKNETHWSIRTPAKRTGISRTAVNTILREYGLKPHLVSKTQYSKDPEFEKKLKEVAGVYMDPPSNIVILCVDEKTRIQALERTQPVLPIIRTVPERQTVDYERHGTTTLFTGGDLLKAWIKTAIEHDRVSKNTKDFIGRIINDNFYVDYENLIEITINWLDYFDVSTDEFDNYISEREIFNHLCEEIKSANLEKISLSVFLQELDLRDKSEPVPSDAFELITIHGAKRLEFQHIYLIGMVVMKICFVRLFHIQCIMRVVDQVEC
jgi:transposase